MNKPLLILTTLYILLISSCSENEKTKSETPKETPTPVVELLEGQWKTEGNDGVVAKWLEFDSLQNKFYDWTHEENKPNAFSGNFKVIGDSIIEMSYTEFNERQQYAIRSITKDELIIISRGISAGQLVYTKTTHSPPKPEEPKIDELTVTGTLKAINESDFWGRVYLMVVIEGEQKLFDYYYKGAQEYKVLDSFIDKRVSISYTNIEEFVSADLYFDQASIHDEYSMVKTEEDRNNYASVEGTLVVHENDISGDTPGSYRIVNSGGDTTTITSFVYESHIALNGKTVTAYYTTNTSQVAQSITVIEEEVVMNSLIFGDWFVDKTKGDVFGSQVIKIRPADEEGVYIDFGQGSNYVKTDIYSNRILGQNAGGSFVLELKEGKSLDYSDDGRGGHFEPIKNQVYNKLESPNFALLKGKWKGINGTEGSIEFTDKLMIDNGRKSPYTLSNVCMNEKIHEQITTLPTDQVVYISTIDLKYGGLSWMIFKLDEKHLSYSYLGTANDFEFERVE